MYSTVVDTDCVDAVVAVTQGDCSNTHALMETWQLEGIRVIPFAYPFDRDVDLLRLQMQKMVEALYLHGQAKGKDRLMEAVGNKPGS